MIANVIILLLVFGYCGLVIYWKRTGVLKDSCSSCGSGNGGCGGGCGGCSGHAAVPMHIIWTAIRQLRNIDPVRCLRLQAGQHM